MNGPVAGVLHEWDEIADLGWEVLLLGNGMSINVSERFAYASLYQEAQRLKDGLSETDRRIFAAFDTSNFEVVLTELRDGITLARAMGRKVGPYRRRFRSVQAALGKAVREVHVAWAEIPDETLEEIRAALAEHKAIFSTCYDLLLYWAMVQGDSFDPFCDCFWANDCNEFSLDDCEVRPSAIPVYYMHGALHLLVGGEGATRKLVQGDRRLLEQFGEPVPGDPDARPLLISEGSHRDKLRAIEANDYLAHVYEAFEGQSGPLVVFGHSLRDQDQHLVGAINANPDRPVAISMTMKDDDVLREERHRILAKLKIREQEVYFFDAATHPLGHPEHRLATPPPKVPS